MRCVLFWLFSRNSGNQLGDWLGSFNPDQALVQPSIEIAQTIGVQPHLLQDGCVYSFDVHPVLDSCCPELIRLSEAHTAFDSAAGHPHGEAVRIVVTSGTLGILGGRLPTKFAAPDNQRFVKQTTLFQIFDQRCDR